MNLNLLHFAFIFLRQNVYFLVVSVVCHCLRGAESTVTSTAKLRGMILQDFINALTQPLRNSRQSKDVASCEGKRDLIINLLPLRDSQLAININVPD